MKRLVIPAPLRKTGPRLGRGPVWGKFAESSCFRFLVAEIPKAFGYD
jgi:hypothetical protein